jgi:hypothetical protein
MRVVGSSFARSFPNPRDRRLRPRDDEKEAVPGHVRKRTGRGDKTVRRTDCGGAIASVDRGRARQWKRVKRKRGRPKVGRGHQRVSISVEKGLLKRITAYAKKRRMTRSGLVAEVFEELLAKED